MILNWRNFWVHMSIILFLITALCKYFLPSFVTKALPIAALLIALAFYSKRNIGSKIPKTAFLHFLFLGCWFCGCFYSPDISKGLGYVFSFLISFLLYLTLKDEKFNKPILLYIFSFFCLVFSLSIIIHPIVPDFISNITKHFSYNVEYYDLIEAWMVNDWFSGLFPERAPAAFYSSMLINAGLFFVFYKNNAKRKRMMLIIGIIFICLGSYSILLTVKRGLLLGSFIAAFLTYITYKKACNLSIWKICISVIILVSIVFLIISNLEGSQAMLLRFANDGDITTGRTKIYANIMRYVFDNFFFGTGTGSAKKVLGIGGHNIYLTILMENGIFTFIIFIAAIIVNLFHIIKISMRIGLANKYEYLPFLMFSLYIQMFFAIYGFSGNPLYDNYILYVYIFSMLISMNTLYCFNKENKL